MPKTKRFSTEQTILNQTIFRTALNENLMMQNIKLTGKNENNKLSDKSLFQGLGNPSLSNDDLKHEK